MGGHPLHELGASLHAEETACRAEAKEDVSHLPGDPHALRKEGDFPQDLAEGILGYGSEVFVLEELRVSFGGALEPICQGVVAIELFALRPLHIPATFAGPEAEVEGIEEEEIAQGELLLAHEVVLPGPGIGFALGKFHR